MSNQYRLVKRMVNFLPSFWLAKERVDQQMVPNNVGEGESSPRDITVVANHAARTHLPYVRHFARPALSTAGGKEGECLTKRHSMTNC